MEDWIHFISNFGFPIALVFYFLLRFEHKIDLLTDSLRDLAGKIEGVSRSN